MSDDPKLEDEFPSHEVMVAVACLGRLRDQGLIQDVPYSVDTEAALENLRGGVRCELNVVIQKAFALLRAMDVEVEVSQKTDLVLWLMHAYSELKDEIGSPE